MEDFLKDIRKEKQIKNVEIYIQKGQLYVFVYSNTGTFSISRQAFEAIENYNKEYNFILINKSKNEFYFLKYNNFEVKNLSQCFKSTIKESLNFTK